MNDKEAKQRRAHKIRQQKNARYSQHISKNSSTIIQGTKADRISRSPDSGPENINTHIRAKRRRVRAKQQKHTSRTIRGEREVDIMPQRKVQDDRYKGERKKSKHSNTNEQNIQQRRKLN